MVYQLSSEMICAISISIPPEDYATLSRYAHLPFVLQRLEEDEVHNQEYKKQMIMRGSKLATMMQEQKKDPPCGTRTKGEGWGGGTLGGRRRGWGGSNK